MCECEPSRRLYGASGRPDRVLPPMVESAPLLPDPRSFHHERRLHALRLVAGQRAEQGVVAGTEIDRQAQMAVRRGVWKRASYRAFAFFHRVQVVFVLTVVDEFYDHLPGGYSGTREYEAKRFGVFGGDLDARGSRGGGTRRGFGRRVFFNR